LPDKYGLLRTKEIRTIKKKLCKTLENLRINSFLDAKHLYEALMSFCLSVCLSVFLSPFSEIFQNLQKALMKGFKGSHGVKGTGWESRGVKRSHGESRGVKGSQGESRESRGVNRS
jgi:hypothetical protein